ncbi:hypothetical protein KXQ82_15410 [Mucilaginibacter sp. HMF5004]|uniref:hypothetical protein n=1 Tax=Mucilaginibacter rivuli TaxID=2857527 RepID=UPI001C5F5E29|nr:hypothetical protein [Mucilaginibacter rivuli]MBW4891112.1 hypothetical protein [Mucilaginibacter rivuli]
MKRIAITIICFAFVVLQGCKKGTAFDNEPIKTRTLRYLTQSTWKQTALEYQNQNGTWTAKTLTATQLAYVYAFIRTGDYNGTYTVYNANNTVNSTGTWIVVGDNTQLALNFSITYDFSVLNDTTMQLALTGSIPYADPSSHVTTQYYGMRETFSH